MQVVLFLLAATALLIVVSGVYVFVAACVRAKEPSWLEPAALQNTPYEKYDLLIKNSDTWLRQHDAEDVYITSSDGLLLHGLWVPAKKPKGTILLAHGYRSTLLIDFGMVLELYHALGMNLLLPDQRAHGKSQGKLITFGVKESDDMLCWIDYHNNHLDDCQMILSGLSMGASTVLFLADRHLPGNVKGIIADCGFSSPAEIISEVFRRTTRLPAVPVIWVTELCARMTGGFSLYERNSCKLLNNNRLPLIMVHGKEDHFVPCEMTQQAYAQCTGDKQLLLVDGAGHGLSYLHAQDAYTGMVVSFLKKHIEGF